MSRTPACLSVEEPANAKDAADRQQDRMLHLDGARTAVAMWIVCHHMAPRNPQSYLDAMMVRVDVGVEFFMLLSGFLMHYLNSEKHLASTLGTLLQFYARRFFRCIFVAYVGMLLCALLQWMGGFHVWNSKTVKCFMFVKTWLDPMPDCPNMPSWFVATLVPIWLLYPLLLHPLLSFSTSRSFHVSLAAVAWILAVAPTLCLIIKQDDWLDWEQVKYTWFWPPALIPDFALGACMAALARHNPPGKIAAYASDVAMIVLLLACALIPLPIPPPGWQGPSDWRPGHYVAWEQLSARLSAPFLCMFLYSSAEPSGSICAWLLSHKTLVGLGNYTLEVYLLQMPLHDIFLWIRPAAAGGFWLGLPWTTEVFNFYVVVLWLLCGLFVELAAEPLNQAVKACTTSWAGRPFSEGLSSASGSRYDPLSVRSS